MSLGKYEVVFPRGSVGSGGKTVVAFLDEDNLEGSVRSLSKCMLGYFYPAVSVSKVS